MKAKDEAKQLEKMLDMADNAIEGNVPQGDLPELHAEPIFEIEYDKITKKCNKQARTMLRNATGMMIGENLVKNNPYLQDKLKTDTISLGGMLYQVELMITMQRALAEEIRHGATSARMFEVFGTLGKTISENNKQLLQTVEAIKLTYLEIKDNIQMAGGDMQSSLGESGVKKTEQGTITMGSRDIIQQANERKKAKLIAKNKDASISDAEEVE